MTDYLRPSSLADALEARAKHPDYMLLAGGTDLLVAAHHKAEPVGIIDVFGLEPLVGIAHADDGAITIGAATTYTDILADEGIRRELPMMVAAVREIGALQIQSRGTIGGNIGTSSPVGDSLPVLLALDATVQLASSAGERTVAYADYCTGYRQTVLAADELIVSVTIPARAQRTVQYWRKVGPRRAQSISKVMVAAVGRVENGKVVHARISPGAVAAHPIRALATEAAITGGAPGPELADAAKAALAGEITPIDDVRSTAEYRLEVAQNLVARFVMLLARDG